MAPKFSRVVSLKPYIGFLPIEHSVCHLSTFAVNHSSPQPRHRETRFLDFSSHDSGGKRDTLLLALCSARASASARLGDSILSAFFLGLSEETR